MGILDALFGRSVLSQAARGVGEAGSLLKSTWNLGGEAAGLVGGKSMVGAIGTKFAKNPMRNTMVGLAGLGSVGALGFAGVGPASDLGSEYTKYLTSRYGDSEETQKKIGVQKTLAGIAGAGLGLAAGAGLFGKGPLATNYGARAAEGFKGLRGSVGNLYETAKTYQFNPAPLPRYAPAKVTSKLKMPSYEPGFLTSENRAYMKKPIRYGLAFGGVGGAAAVLGEGARQTQLGGFEGNITGISSSPNGGISPELQFSTQDLMFALHRNNKSMRMRYQ